MMYKTLRRDVVKDLRAQLREIERAITEGNEEDLEALVNDVGGHVYLLINERSLCELTKSFRGF